MLKKNLYRNQYGDIYYKKMIDGELVQLSTHTKDERTANKLHTALEYQALNKLYNPVLKDKETFMPFKNLVLRYLGQDHEWTKESRKMTEGALFRFIKQGVPENKNAAIIVKQRVNTCINWVIKNNIVTDTTKFEKIGLSIPRTRVFNDAEMDLIKKEIQDEDFQLFIQFAYYTGCRRGELVGLKAYDFKPLYFEVNGKSGNRLVRLNRQAREVLSMKEGIWEYRGDYISKQFKKNLRRLEIVDGRFHDLRRTFGFNLIRNGMPIFKVSKLLGHSSIVTTERHYAPLLATNVEDFVL